MLLRSWKSAGRRSRRVRAAFRKLNLEPLESRRVMTGRWQNAALAEDVDGSGFISLADVLMVVAALRNNDANPIDLSMVPTFEGPPPFLDVTDDDLCSLQDLLAIVVPLREGIGLPAPALEAGLANDTPPNTADGVTTDATIAGRITSNLLPGAHLVAVIEESSLPNISGVPLAADGSFSFVPNLSLGSHTVKLFAQTLGGPVTQMDVTFELIDDTTPLQIEPVPELTIHPGRLVEVDLTVSGGEAGAPVTFTVDVLNLPGGLPTGRIEGNGKLIFEPTVDEIGSYTFDVLAHNGQQTARRTVTLHVTPDSATSTRLMGTVFDLDGNPLAGVPVMVDDFQTITDENGVFLIDDGGAMPPDGEGEASGFASISVNASALGPQYVDLMLPVERFLGSRGGVGSVQPGERNDFRRGVFVPALDLDSGMAVNPDEDTLITNPDLPGTSLMVPAGTIVEFDDQGNEIPYTGKIFLTSVPPNRTELPLDPKKPTTTVVRVDAERPVAFVGFASLTVPNNDGFRPDEDQLGYSDPFGRLLPAKAEPLPEGGSKINGPIDKTGENQTQGNQTADPLGETPPNDAKNEDKKRPCPPDPAVCPAMSEIELHSGNFLETHDLVTYQSQGAARGITLAYNSEWADPRPIVYYSFGQVSGSFFEPPDFYAADPASVRLMATLQTRIVNATGGAFTIQAPGIGDTAHNLQAGENVWRYSGDTAEVALQLDLRGAPTGIYERSGSVAVRHLGPQGWVGNGHEESRALIHINEIDSPFGTGWGIAGLQKIVEAAGGALILVDGGGEETVFDPREDGGYQSPRGDFSTMEKLPDGSYRRTWPDQTVDLFDNAGRVVRSTDRNGNAARYEYDALGRLVKMIDPVGLETTLDYAGGKLSTITDPVGRVTRFAHDEAGNMTRIEDPDGSVRQFGYDELHHLTRQTDKRNAVVTVQYGPGGRGTGEIIPAYTTPDATDTITMTSLVEKNLAPFATGASRDPIDSPAAGTDLESLVTWTGQGRQESTALNQFALQAAPSGAAFQTRFDAVGALPQVLEYNFNHQPASTIRPAGGAMLYSYNQHGDVIVASDSEDVREVDIPDFGSTTIIDAIRTFGGVVTLHDVEALSGPSLTLEAWVNIHGRPNFFGTEVRDNIITTNEGPFTDTPYGYGFGVDLIRVPGTRAPDSLLTVSTPGGGARNIPFSEVPFLEDEWRHIAVVYTPGEAKTYVDGQLVDAYTFTQGDDPVGTNLVLGKDLEALIDEVRIWNVARTEAEIQRSLGRALTGAEPGLESYFPFDVIPTSEEELGQFDLTDHGPAEITATTTGRIDAWSDSPLIGTRYTYDTRFQQVTSITDSNGHQTVFEIDPDTGDTLSMTRVVGEFGGDDDLVTTFTYLASGLVDTITDPLGRVSDFEYDARERLISITLAQGTADEGIWRYEYDDAGNQTAIVDPNGQRTEFEYDVMNRVTKITEQDPDDAGPLASPVTEMTYNLAGDLLTATDPQGRTTRFEYDARGAVREMINSDGGVTTYVRNAAGNVVSMTDPLDHETQFVYDGRQRLIETIDPDGGRTRFEYNLNDNVTAIVDPNDNRTQYFYDTRDRLVRRRDPLGQEEFFVYDFVDNLLEYTDRNGRKTTYAYDDLDRRVSETWVDGGNAFAFAYDKLGNLLSVEDAFSHLAMTYDNRDRPESVDNAMTPDVPRVQLAYAYDAAGNMLSTSASVAGSPFLTNAYEHDRLNRLTRITQSGPGVSDKRVDFAYNALGQFDSIRRFQDLTGAQLVAATAFGYDVRNRLTSLTHTSAANATLAFENLTYDLADRITRIVNGDGQTDYTYDDRDQLTGAAHSDAANPDETYAYDPNGNRLDSHLHGDGYETGPNNRLLSDGVFNYAYDDEGNLTRRTEIATGAVRDFTWDFRNRLTAVIDKASESGPETQRVEFTYDAFNRRISKTVTAAGLSETTHFVYDGANVLFDFHDADGPGPAAPQLAQTYLHGPAVDQVLAQDDGSAVDWLLADHLGSITDLVDHSGDVVNHVKYDAYGNRIDQSNSTANTRYGFTGREHDAETDLAYYRARYYDAGIGKFVSEDPIGFQGGQSNLHQYVLNAPTNLIDPDGRAWLGYTNQGGGIIGPAINMYRISTPSNLIQAVLTDSFAAHAQFFFEHGHGVVVPGTNQRASDIGWGRPGPHPNQFSYGATNRKDYRKVLELDDAILAQAITEVGIPSGWSVLPPYADVIEQIAVKGFMPGSPMLNYGNCQTYAKQVLLKYLEILARRGFKTGVH